MGIENVNSILLKNTSFTPDQLKFLMKSATDNGPTVGELLSQGSSQQQANAEELLAILCQEMKLPFIKDIPVNDISVDLIRKIPINYAKSHEILPYKDEGDSVTVLVSNPLNSKVLNDLQVLYNKRTKPLVTTSSKLQDAINRVYEKSTAALDGLDDIEQEEYDLDEPIIDLLEAGDDDAPVIRLVNTLLFRAVKEKASDIHIEPYERDLVIRFRIDGVLYDIFKPPKKLQNSITSRIKVMANLNIAEKRLPQDGRIPLKLAGKDIDIRLSTLPTAHGERLVMRLQDRSNVVLQLEQLGFSTLVMDHIGDLLEKTHGIILVTGPTGSGKSTTLYACLTKINSTDLNIVTVEDPVEQRVHGIGQTQVNPKIGLTFASGLRAILRQDPDVIMIGEIRDFETAEIAINASLTGHLVLSTLHTNDSAGVVPRLLDMGCEPFLIASSLLGVAAQRLVRVLCPHCKATYEPTDAELASVGMNRAELVNGKIYKAIGCNQCNQKGYIGRSVVSELMIISDTIRQLILQKKDGNTIKKTAIEEGMLALRSDGVKKVIKGITTIEELIANTQADD